MLSEMKKVSAMNIIGSLAKDISFSNLPQLGVHQLLVGFARDVKIEQINLIKPSLLNSPDRLVLKILENNNF